MSNKKKYRTWIGDVNSRVYEYSIKELENEVSSYREAINKYKSISFGTDDGAVIVPPEILSKTPIFIREELEEISKKQEKEWITVI